MGLSASSMELLLVAGLGYLAYTKLKGDIEHSLDKPINDVKAVFTGAGNMYQQGVDAYNAPGRAFNAQATGLLNWGSSSITGRPLFSYEDYSASMSRAGWNDLVLKG